MRGLKAPANSCQSSRTRSWSVELKSSELHFAVTQTLVEMGYSYDRAIDKIWPRIWSQIKLQPSYTIRVNGRVTIQRQRVLSKSTRTKVKQLQRSK